MKPREIIVEYWAAFGEWVAFEKGSALGDAMGFGRTPKQNEKDKH